MVGAFRHSTYRPYGSGAGFVADEVTKKASRLFDITRQHGAITSQEASIRLGNSSAKLGIEKLLDLKLLTELSEGIFGLSDKARRLIEKWEASEQVVGFAEYNRL
jgi:hypothetical protein